MLESGKIWMNGELVDWGEAKVHVLTHALHYGSGVFEGIRAYETDRGPAVFRLSEHLEAPRPLGGGLLHEAAVLRRGAAAGDARDDRGQRASPPATSGRSPSAATGRWASTRSNCPVEVMIAVWPWGAYLGEEALEHGVRAMISSWRRIGPNTIPAAAKATRPVPELAAREARGDEARLRRGDPAQRAGLPRRRLGRERVRGPRRRARHAAGARPRACPASRATR